MLMKQKFLVCCLLAILPAFTAFAYDFESDGIYYTITSTNTVSVVNGTYAYDGDITIPKTVSNGGKTYNVKAIGESAFKSTTELENVTLPEGLTTIGNQAFYGSGVKSINLPTTLNSMGTSAFQLCKNLKSIALPDALKEIKEYAFSENSSLKTMTLGNQTISIEKYAFEKTVIEHLVIPSSVKTIGPFAFHSNASLKSLTINNAAVFLDYDVFYNCTGLETVDLGNSITGFGTYTNSSYNQWYGSFRDCKSLAKIVIPSSVTVLSDNTFRGCSRLYDVTLPNTLISIGARAFESCAIKELTIPSSVTSIGQLAFYGSPIEKVVFPASSNVTIIGEQAFSGCPLKSISFPSSLRSIGSRAFQNTSLETLTIPQNITSIGWGAFESNVSLHTLKIEDASIDLYYDTFRNCTALRNVDLGSKITGFVSSTTGAFQGCTSLESIAIPNTVKSLTDNVFNGCTSLKQVVLSNTLTSIGHQTFYYCSKLEEIELPNTLQSIGTYAFYGCSNLQNIILPESMKTIGGSAFYGCGIHEIVIPEGVTSIGEQAFICGNLKKFIIDNAVLTIGNSVCRGCANLEYVDLGRTTTIGAGAFSNCIKLTNIEIPNSVTQIESANTYNAGAFAGCTSLKYVIVGTGMTFLGNRTFYGCSKLSNVVFKTGEPLTIGNEVFSSCRSLKKIELSASLSSVGENVFKDCSVLSHIYMYPTTPPTIRTNTFADYTTPTLHVPAASKTAYTKADIWKQFTNIVAIGEEPKASAEEVAALEALLMQAQTLYNSSVEGDEQGNYRPGAKAALKAVIAEVEERIVENMLVEDVEDCTELLETAIRSFKNKQVKNDVQTNNTLSFAGSLKAATGMEFRLPIEMTNTDAITGVQFDLYLPEGMMLSEDEHGDFMIELSRTTTRRHSVASRVMDDGALRVVISSTQNATFEGNSGTIITLVLFPKSTLEAGDYNVTLRNIILTDPDAKRYASADMTSVVTVSNYTMGDVNNDGYIDVADLAGVVRFILENADASLVFNAADMDGNGVIEINDYAALVNVILSQASESRPMLSRGYHNVLNDVITVSDMTFDAFGEGELFVHLTANDAHYTGLQFDLRLPESIELADAGAEAVGSRHGAWMTKRTDGTYRVVCASMENDELNEGPVMCLKVKALGTVNGVMEAVADDVVLADVSAVRHEAALAKASMNTYDATGINTIENGQLTIERKIYNLAGQRVQKMQKGLYIINGKKTANK